MFFFLTGGPGLLRAVLAYLPLTEADKQRMLEKFVSVTRATLKGTISPRVRRRPGHDETTRTRSASRSASRAGSAQPSTDVPGIVYLEIDGLALPVLRRAMRDGNAPTMARWLADGSHRLPSGRPTSRRRPAPARRASCSAPTTTSPPSAGSRRRPATLMTCSAPPDCAEIERRLATGIGLLADGGASRGNLLSGEADDVILTVSRIDAEKRSNPGYRAFLANGYNVTRALVLFFWEVVARVDRPRCGRSAATCARAATAAASTRSCAAAMCVVVRDLIVYGVLTDMMRGRPAVYATFSSYDEVAHHSGPRAGRHAGGAAQARPAVRRASSARAATRRGRTRSSSSPTTARRRARRSSSATATASTSSSSARSSRGDVDGDRRRRRAERDGRPRRQRGDRAQKAKTAEERRLRPRRGRARLRQPRPRST